MSDEGELDLNKVSKSHIRRAMNYIEETSYGDVEYDQILALYRQFREEGNRRVSSLLLAMGTLLFDKIVSEGYEDENNPEIFVFKYKGFPYRLEVRRLEVRSEDTGNYTFIVIGTDKEGIEYEATSGYGGQYISTREDGVLAFIETITYDAIVNTR